jgi:hypothetical protein
MLDAAAVLVVGGVGVVKVTTEPNEIPAEFWPIAQ